MPTSLRSSAAWVVLILFSWAFVKAQVHRHKLVHAGSTVELNNSLLSRESLVASVTVRIVPKAAQPAFLLLCSSGRSFDIVSTLPR